MVFTSIINFVRSRGPDEFWRKRKIFKLSSHFIGRRRNCYSIVIKNVHRALVYASKGRKLKKTDMSELWNTRLCGAVDHYGISHSLEQKLTQNNIFLNKKVTSDLAVWEPKSFEYIVNIAKENNSNHDQ